MLADNYWLDLVFLCCISTHPSFILRYRYAIGLREVLGKMPFSAT